MARHSAEVYKGQRGKEKHELFKRFVHPSIVRLYKRRFFALFDNQCFKCTAPERPVQLIGEPPVLCMDHHIPMSLGGHLVPGNLVSLCRKCNELKLDRAPAAFYKPEELLQLQPLLEQQEALFAFTFDWEAMNTDPAAYLISVGVDPAEVQEMASNPDHPDYFGDRSRRHEMTITIDGAELLRTILAAQSGTESIPDLKKS